MTDETKETKQASDCGETQEQPTPAMQQLVDMGSSVVKNRHGTVHCLTIVGQVEGHMVLPNNTKSTKYEHVLPLLASLEESDDVDGLLLLLNTVGGDIEAGLAIAEGGDLTEEEINSREDIRAVGMYGDELAEPDTKVEYDLHGFIQNVYYKTDDGTGYQLAPPDARG